MHILKERNQIEDEEISIEMKVITKIKQPDRSPTCEEKIFIGYLNTIVNLDAI